MFWKFILWLKPSFEGEDGQASHRKIAAYFFGFLVFLMVILTFINNDSDTFSEVTWISITGGALGMSYIRKLHTDKQLDHKDHTE